MDESETFETAGVRSPAEEAVPTATNTTDLMSSSENMNNENREKELSAAAAEKAEKSPSAENVTYKDDGTAIYTDPTTKFQYEWDKEKNEWTPSKSTESSDPYENEHFRWCHETNKWIRKDTEFYRWNEETESWIPKTASSQVTELKDGVHTYTDKDGVVFFWDTEKNAWFPKIDDDFMAVYQMNYGFVDNTTKEVKPPAEADETEETSESAAESAESAGGAKKRKQPDQPRWFELPPEKNTKVYVTNLPLDTTEEEFAELMSKYGMIIKDPHTNKLKIKLYREADGQLKGDALCHYIKVESVQLALNLLDGTELRGHKIGVERAAFQMRGEYNPALKPKKKKKDKEKMQKMQEKLFAWHPEKMRGERAKHERVVIIKNLFDPELFEREVQLILDYQKDLREECSKCGRVRKVIIYDRHPDGVAQISMGDPEEADVVVQMMQGRFFGQRRLIASLWDGQTKYKSYETEEEKNDRLSNWDKYLEDDEEPSTKDVQEAPAEQPPQGKEPDVESPASS